VIAELSEAYGVTRVTATLDPDNLASLALLRKLELGLVAEDAAAHEVTCARDLR
jgi:RimJ/RimL family protein N-acetyltransferase